MAHRYCGREESGALDRLAGVSAQLHRALSCSVRVLLQEDSQQISDQKDRERLGEMFERLMRLAPNSIRSELQVGQQSAAKELG